MTDTLRGRLAAALNAAPASFVRDDPEDAAAHAEREHRRHDRHKYYGGCALCRGEAETLADAVLPIVEELRAERDAALAALARVREFSLAVRASGDIKSHPIAQDILRLLDQPVLVPLAGTGDCGYVRERWDGPYRMRDRCTAAAGHSGDHGPWAMLPDGAGGTGQDGAQ